MSLQTEQLNELHWMMEVLHTIDVGLVVLDRDYTIQIWNGFMENHSGLLPREVKGKLLFDLFDEIPQDWFRRKAESVFLLKNKAFTIWEQRPYVFKFNNYRPITGTAEFMYQNTTFIPLKSTTGEVSHLCLLVYDVTDNATQKKQLKKANADLAILSRTDGLTQLFNRNHWQQSIAAEFKRYTRNQHASCLVMLDIDHFKAVNDNYGHLVGDDVIRHLAKFIREQVRETDISARYGGEEFIILLADTHAEGGLIFAERLRKTVAESVVIYNGIEVQYTISLGVAQIQPNYSSERQWLEHADNALYQSKDNGRNKATIYQK
ncbi:diguanylate cyclase [Colwellia sp. MB02u-18]|uniref:sensor domain-containing diguanylate cyclase n=1 Tax=unclassified Colwellia TaxID=196834 RepID=UPI0015F5D51D|nr:MULTISPECIES: diguanylate cyclase [unclassified Colwellia]MBA6223936.1 diguanylate cyclase [Colwellia sp. MB3u-45]MBA6267357.1 diguanylate cyclase [Colwellia sp. MB3u-43]MBA6320117.1 diguanylate cyclase [Colwellia sp. MB02u-19]MBA6324813.1 diguanylate cyclase [Colwellia sp. MB02u-18]MBA6330494.1 diguanylate cyclase [Colwellia sp. MB02u-12]